MQRILFLCMGNICRSPAAHCVFQHLVDEAGLEEGFQIDSAGTLDFHEGSPPDARMQAAMRQRKIPIIGRSRPLTKRDLLDFDLILAMDKANLIDARCMAINDDQRDKVQLFTQYCTKHEIDEVPDPYYDSDHGFDHVLNIVEDGCDGLLKALRQNVCDRGSLREPEMD